MKKYLPIIAIIIIDIFAISYYAFGMTFNGTPYELQQLRGEQMLGATYIFPYDGGTGTSTSPTYGDILVGNAGGTYTLTATSTLFAGASLWQQNGSDIYYNSGDVGIGTTSPNHKLDVNGNIGLKESQYINWGYTDGDSGYGFKDNSGTLQYKNVGGSWADIGSGGGGGSGTVTSVDMSVPAGLTISGNPITTSGTLALDLDTGYQMLTDTASSTWDNKWDLTYGLFDIYGQATSTITDHTTTYNHDNYDTAYTWGDHAGLYDIRGQATSTKDWLLTQDNVWTGAGNTTFAGNIGIGTTSPWGLLSVNAPGGTDPFVVGSSTGTQFIVKESGNVGIGQTIPTSLLDLIQTQTTGSTLSAYRNLASASTDSPLMFLEQDNSGDDQNALSIQNDGTGKGLFIDQNGEGQGLNIDSESTTSYALNVDALSYRAARILQQGDDKGLYVQKTGVGVGTAIEIVNSGTGDTLLLDTNGNAKSINIDSEATSATVLNVTAENTSGNIVNIDDKFVMNYLGNVGIGDTTPANGKLEILQTDVDNYHLYASGNGCVMNLGRPNSSYHGSFGFLRNVASDVSANPVVHFQNSNTGDDQHLLNLYDSASATTIKADKNNSGIIADLDGDANSASDLIGLRVDAVNSGAGEAYAAIFKTGNVGIGTDSPTGELEVDGRLVVGLGLQSAPSFSFAGDSDTGIYSPGNDIFRFTTGGLSRLSMEANGNVGLGAGITTNALFHIYGYDNEAAANAFIVEDENQLIDFQLTSSGDSGVTGATAYFRGNVGIGTTSPNHTLDVNGNIGLKESQYINWGYTDGESGYGFKDNSGTLQYKSSGGSWADIGSGGGGGSDVNWTFFNGSGIRVSTSTNQVLVGGTATSTSAFLEVNSPGGTDPFFIGSSSPYLVVKESGRIGIATSSPSENLDIYNDTATSTGYIYSGGSELGGEIVLEDTDGAGCSKQYTLDGLLYIDTITCP